MNKVQFDEAKAKAKLERAIHQPVGAIRRPIWNKHLKSEVRQHLEGAWGAYSWEQIKDLTREWLELQKDMELDFVGAYQEESAETKRDLSSPKTNEDEVLTRRGLSERTKARARAMSELSALRTGLLGEPPQITPVKARVRTGGGRREATLYRWVVSLDVEVWVPAEEVARVYRNLQRQFINEHGSRTEEGTFEVARFVWREQRRNGGIRPSWRVLLERWKQEHPKDHRFKTYSNFRQFFVRGEEATVPHYETPEVEVSPEARFKAQQAKDRIEALFRSHIERHGNRPFKKLT